MWVRGHSRSLKLLPFESLGVVFYSPSIVTMAISVDLCEIFSVKERCDLENLVRGRSRSLKMASFNRQYATFYWSAILLLLLVCVSFTVYHNWSATKQRRHPQSVAEISRHSVLSGDRIRQCETSSGSRHKDTYQCL